MDSRLIAGAYSQHFRALEKDQLEDSVRDDSVTRAKRLSQETNKRRKYQAHKRKLEAQREERRRQDILSKRREEQKKATEKYQRSHIPHSARHGSGRSSPRRHVVHGGPALEDALRLIRESPRNHRPRSAFEKTGSTGNENQDPLEKSYIENRHHASRPSSGRASHLVDPNLLRDYSMQNLTSSKSLFEQQLEQQQHLLLEQQHQSLREFNNAVQNEIINDKPSNVQNKDLARDYLEDERNFVSSDSCSSIDSLEDSIVSDQHQANGNSANHMYKTEQSEKNEDSVLPSQKQKDQGEDPGFFTHVPLNQDMTPSATYQAFVPVSNGQTPAGANQRGNSFVGVTRENIFGKQAVATEAPLKQFSQDSLMESGSSTSSLSVIKLPDNKQDNVVTSGPYNAEKDEMEKRRLMTENSQAVMKSIANAGVGSAQGGSGYDSAFNDAVGSAASQVTHSPQLDLLNMTQTSGLTRPDLVMTDYNPRYASAIGLSIWPGSTSQYNNSSTVSSILVNNQHPYSTRGTLTSATSTVSFQTSNVPSSTGSNVTAGQPTMNTYNSGSSALNTANIAVTKSVNQNNTFFGDLNTYDFKYPTVHYQQVGVQDFSSTLPQSVSSEVASISPSLQQVNFQAGLADMTKFTSSGVQSYQQISAYQQRLNNPASHVPTISRPDIDNQPTTMMTAPVPAVRSVHLNVRPMSATNSVSSLVNQNRAHSAPVSRTQPVTNASLHQNTGQNKVEDITADEEEDVEEEMEEPIPIRGILKTAAPKGIGQTPQKGAQGKPFPRDSLELARRQAEMKGKKKSVRFAEVHIEEFDENEQIEQPVKTTVVTNAGVPMYKPSVTRPVSAKVVSSTQRQVDAVKTTRASSAGTVRQPAMYTDSKASTTATPTSYGTTTTNTVKDSSPSAFNQRTNLPPSNPLNTTPINRPKAAAHIIMSSDHSPQPHSPTSSSAAAVAHKSHLDTKVKPVSNNFMSKVPVKASAANAYTNGVVYNVARAGGSEITSKLASNSQAQNNTDGTAKENYNQQLMQDRSKMTGSKRVPISNANVTRTTVESASTKITAPQSNSGSPSYASTYDNSSNTVVYDENGLRIDRTPTDEEITWLWDKVRNCLSKEEEKKAQGGAQTEPSSRPVLSTKIIDGAALGIGPSNTGNSNLRPGSGYFYTRTTSAPSSQQNKVKPAVQQTGSYLRRYGLLKQRRVQSANPLGPSQPAQGTQQTPNVMYGRQLSHPTVINQQFQTPDYPPSPTMGFNYKPQDNVSESTAAFIMAERLAKQSLSDSHIQVAMEDAQSMQEVHNKVRNTGGRGGHSALSIEEQRLMESLDKLNERLKVNDNKFNGTIHYHQGYQPHLPGFRGHQVYSDASRGRQMPSPRTQQRAQSARIRAQTRQYR